MGGFEGRLKKWVSKLSAAAISGASKGAAYSVCLDIIFMHSTPLQLPLTLVDHQFLSLFRGYRPMMQSLITRTGLKQASTLAVFCSTGSVITSVMKELRGKEDVQTCMVAAFGAGAMLSVVTGLRGPEVISFGVMFALLQGGLFMVTERPSKGKAEKLVKLKAEDVFFSNQVFFTGNALSMHTDDRKEKKKGGGKTWLHY